MEVNQKAAQLLRDARDLMNDEGRHWIKGEYVADGHFGLSYCSIGALREAVGIQGADAFDVAEFQRALCALAAIITGAPIYEIGEAEGWATDTVIDWNDEDEREWEEVSEAFEKAAASLV